MVEEGEVEGNKRKEGKKRKRRRRRNKRGGIKACRDSKDSSKACRAYLVYRRPRLHPWDCLVLRVLLQATPVQN